MQISEHTITVLNNFSSINQGLIIASGDVLKTVSAQKNVMASAKLPDKFPQEAGIYNLSRFISTLSLFDTPPDLKFNKNTVVISGSNRKINYALSETSLMIQPPDKDFDMENPLVEFEISWDNIQNLQKAASVLNLPIIEFAMEDHIYTMRTLDTSNPTSDTYEEVISEDAVTQTSKSNFKVSIRTENMKILPGKYSVRIKDNVCRFTSDENSVVYWMSIER
jgi:hypothetical protein|tara:strand:- start:4 stop:669 length:666 start_codon:yes stop_codon:yes gene_type:complete